MVDDLTDAIISQPAEERGYNHNLDSAGEIIGEYTGHILTELDKSTIEYDYSILVGKENPREVHIVVIRRPEDEVDPELTAYLGDVVIDEPDRRDFYLIAHDENHVLGIKEFGHIESNSRAGEYSAGGYTAVYEQERGKGVGYALEIAAIDLCQRESNRLGKKINWSVSDANAVGLFALEKTTGMDTGVIEKKKLEHERWQRLYSGLGFAKVESGPHKKSFSPQSNNLHGNENNQKTQAIKLASEGKGEDLVVAASGSQEIEAQIVKDKLRELLNSKQKNERPRDRT